MRPIWNGKGQIVEDGPNREAYWTKDSGEIVGRPYVRERASRGLSAWRDMYSLEARRAVLAATVDDDAWLSSRAFETVGSIVRDVVDHLLRHQRADLLVQDVAR